MKPFIVKTSLTEKMGGASRVITAEQTERAIVINDVVDQVYQDSNGKLPLSGKTWQFFKEPASALPKNGGGMILREFKDAVQNDIVLPWYSLISERPASEHWIDELYRYSGHKNMKEFIWNDLAKPVMEMHSELALKNGITTELHQQNLMIVIDKDTKKVKGLMLRDMDGNWVDHSLRVNYLHKASTGTGSLYEDAKTLNYVWAQDNQFNSYAEIIRERSFGNIFKYAMPIDDVQWIQKKSDQFYVEEFNKTFPKYKVEDVTKLKERWQQIHADFTTDAESLVYNQIKAEKYKPISVMGKTLQNYRDEMVTRKLSGALSNPADCLSVFLKQIFK